MFLNSVVSSYVLKNPGVHRMCPLNPPILGMSLKFQVYIENILQNTEMSLKTTSFWKPLKKS